MEKGNINFVAIDFETMTPELTSACAVGMVQVVNGVIMQKFYSLIKPYPDERTERNTFVHGITEEMVENAPTWDIVFPVLRSFAQSGCIACHNEGTEANILSRLAEVYNLDMPGYQIIDTMRLLPGNNSLKKMCELMGIEMHDHHDALADATACAEIVLKGAGIDVTHHHYEKPDYKSHKSLTGEVKQPLADEDVANKDNPFFHQKVVITGVFTAFPDREKLAFRLRDCGADINSSISAKTNIVKFLAFFLAVPIILRTFANAYKTIVNYPAGRPLSPMASSRRLFLCLGKSFFQLGKYFFPTGKTDMPNTWRLHEP